MSSTIRPNFNLKAFSHFLFDCDGVIWNRGELLPGAQQLISHLKSIGKNVCFLTNNSTSTAIAYVQKFSDLNIRVEPEDVIITSNITAKYLAQKNVKKVYGIGSNAMKTELDSLGIKNCGFSPDDRTFRDLKENAIDKEVDTVLVGFDSTFNLIKASLAATYIMQGNCAFYATNTDATCPHAHVVMADTGSIVSLIETATGRHPTIIGKPHQPMFDAISARLGGSASFNPADCVMIGDRLDTDILFGNKFGMTSVLTLTGVTTREMVEAIKSGVTTTLDDNNNKNKIMNEGDDYAKVDNMRCSENEMLCPKLIINNLLELQQLLV